MIDEKQVYLDVDDNYMDDSYERLTVGRLMNELDPVEGATPFDEVLGNR